jgi:hypothetical protein
MRRREFITLLLVVQPEHGRSHRARRCILTLCHTCRCCLGDVSCSSSCQREVPNSQLGRCGLCHRQANIPQIAFFDLYANSLGAVTTWPFATLAKQPRLDS